MQIISAGIGAIVGGYVTWTVATRAARDQARRNTLIETARGLQDYGVAYAQWYTEYLSPQARSVGHWAKPPTGKPDSVYLGLMGAVDRGMGNLKVIQGLLYAHFPQRVINPLSDEIAKVLVLSKGQADCREIDHIVNGACDMIPDLVRKYSQSHWRTIFTILRLRELSLWSRKHLTIWRLRIMETLVQQFTAVDDAGTEHRLLVYQKQVPAPTRKDSKAVIPGLKRIVTEYGDTTNRLKKGEYQIVATGVVLRSSDPDAP